MENQQNSQTPAEALDFGYQPTERGKSIIKVVGVGGGGSNAVRHMFESGIQDVSFLIINTDKQALVGSPIPNKLQISDKGLGAGAQPGVARAFALQYKDEIRQALSDGTEMIFITAGMGGGTGTGASPVVAEIAHEMGILTIGIVTIPFQFEGKRKIAMALEGVDEISKYVDALLVVNNNRLINIYPDLNFFNAFSKADDTLTIAAKSISDIINVEGYMNLDFADVSTTLRNGGVALISTGQAAGEGRLSKAIQDATNSPLLQDNQIKDAKHLLFEICFSNSHPITMAEINEMNHFVESLNSEIDVIWGAMVDDSLGEEVRIILLASGFAMDHNTGTVIPSNDDENRELRNARIAVQNAILAAKAAIEGVSDYAEAVQIIQQAISEADATTVRDSNEAERVCLGLQQAQEKAQLKANELIQQQERQKEIDKLQAQLAALQKEAAMPKTESATIAETQEAIASDSAIAETPAPAAESPAPTAEAPAPATASPAQAEPTVAAEPQSLESLFAATEPQPEPAPEPQQAQTTAPTQAPAPGVRPATSIQDAIEQMRKYYGDEAAEKMQLEEVRKAYCILNDEDLTNEELIARLEKLPAYNRTIDDLGQLRAVNVKPATPKVIGNGNIHF